jgi:hypothetical protein
MLLEEVMDGTERTEKRISSAMTATTDTEKINKKNTDVSSY